MVYQHLCNRTIKPVSLGLLAVGVAGAVRTQPLPTPIANGTALDTIVRQNLDGDYVLTDHIYLNETNGGQWAPIGNLSQPFRGTLDGNSRIIYGLNVTTIRDNTLTGLFGKIQDSWVRRLVLDRPFIQSLGYESHIGSVAGVAHRSNITDSVNQFGTVRSYGLRAYTGGITGWGSDSTISSGNLNTGAVSSEGYRAYTGGTNGVASDSTISNGNLNTGAVSSNGDKAYTGGTNGYAWSQSTISGNLNTGAVSSNGTHAYTGGTNGAASESTVNGNLNTGAVSSKGKETYTGGTNGAASESIVNGNLNTGSVSSNGSHADTGGTNGYARYYSTVSRNLNTGAVNSKGKEAYTGGTNGAASESIVNGNLNIGSVSSNGSHADTGGTVGDAESSAVSGNLNTGIVTSRNGTINTLAVLGLNKTQIQSGNNGLNHTIWHNGKNTQYPMPRGINPAYWDLRRINGTRNGNHTNTFPAVLDEFADPGGPRNDSLFDRAVWNVRDGYLPFLRHINRQVVEQIGINCEPGGFACSESANCLFTSQSPGTLEYLLYDGQRYHGVVKATGSGLAYWIAYKNDSYLALGPCGVYGFTDISSAGIVVDAAVNRGNSVYIAYHVPALPGQAQPGNSRLEMLTLSDGQLQQAALMRTPMDGRITSLSIDGSDVLLNTGQAIYRLASNNQLTSDLQGRHALRSREVIQSVSGKDGDLYLLTHEPDTGYRIRTVPESGTATFLMVTTSSGITTSKQLIAFLKISGERLHLLMIDSRSIIWRKYRLAALVDAPEEAQESEAFATLSRGIIPASIALLPGQVLIMGQNSAGQPWYNRLTPADFTFSPGSIATSMLAATPTSSPDSIATTPTPSPASNGEKGHSISEWPWWAKTIFGTGVSVIGLAAFTTISCLAKKGWNYHRHRGGKPDVLQRIYQQLQQQNQHSTQGRQGQPRARLPLPGMPPRPGFRGNPDGSNAISVESMHIQPNGLGQKPSGYLEVVPSEAQPYQHPITLYEKVVPREERESQISQSSGNPNKVHDYEVLEEVEVRATEQRQEYHEMETLQRLEK